MIVTDNLTNFAWDPQWMRYGPRPRNNSNNNNNNFVTRTTRLHPSGELFTAGAPTATSLGELLLINGIIDRPNPIYPALCLQDTTHSWNRDYQAKKHSVLQENWTTDLVDNWDAARSHNVRTPWADSFSMRMQVLKSRPLSTANVRELYSRPTPLPKKC